MKKTHPHPPLNEAELDQLDTFLTSLGPAGMSLEMLDGYLTALICGPDMVLPSEFLPEIWGEEFAFDDSDQANMVVDLIMRHWKTIADELHQAPHIYMPILEKDADGIARGNDWALGFMRGMQHEDWNELIDSEEEGGPIVIIMLLAHENDLDPALRPPPILDDKREEIIRTMIAGTSRIYRYFAPHRRSLSRLMSQPSPFSWRRKVGRNEPCPCGSGYKYKRCCGPQEPLLH